MFEGNNKEKYFRTSFIDLRYKKKVEKCG